MPLTRSHYITRHARITRHAEFRGRGTGLKKIGKKGRAWANARRKLKPVFERMGVVTCEAGLKGCWRDNALSFAHHSKRRKLKAGELEIVALLCIPCHDVIERYKPARMKRFILWLIGKRETAA